MRAKIFVELIFPFFLFIFTLTIYILTLSRSVYFGDSGEFIAVAKTLGIAHPPGYPLYTMLAHLFTYLPFGNLAFRVNLFSAVTSSLTVVVIYFACLKLTKNRLASASASLFLAFSYLFWLYSLVAEVFSLNNLFVALIVLISLHIFEKPNHKLFYLLSFVFGLALTNHHTIVLLTPALLFLIFATNPKLLLNPKFIILSSFFFLLGLLPYLYLPIRASQDPILNWGDPQNLENFIRVIFRKDYGSFSLSPIARASIFDPKSTSFYFISIVRSFSLLSSILIPIGLYFIFANRRVFLFTILIFLFLGPLFIIITRSQITPAQKAVLERFFVSSFVVFPIWISYSLYVISHFVRKLIIIPLLIFLSVFLTPLLINFSKVDQKNNFLYEEYGRELFSQLPENAIILYSHDEFPMISQYLQITQNKRPDLKFLNFTLLPAKWYQENAKQRYKDLTFPFYKFNLQMTQSEATGIICSEIVNSFHTFTDRWIFNAFPKGDQGCSYLPAKLAVKLEKPNSKLETASIDYQKKFWKGENTILKTEKPNDYRTKTVIITYSDMETFFANYLDQDGFSDEARNYYQSALNLFNENTVTAQLLAENYSKSKNFDSAIELEEKVVEIIPKHAPAHKNLGYWYLDRGDKKKHIIIFENIWSLHLVPRIETRSKI